MSEMVDQVALALSQSFKEAIVAGRGMKFEETKVDLPPTEIWHRYAVAAIEAMRDPTSGMQSALGHAYRDGLHMREVWNAAIDEALK